jgi:hypothetical protein
MLPEIETEMEIGAEINSNITSIVNGQQYYIRNVQSNMYFTAGTIDSHIVQSSFNGSTRQRWRANTAAGGGFTLTPMNDTNSRLSLWINNNSNGIQLRLEPHNQNSNLHAWRIDPITSGGITRHRIYPASFNTPTRSVRPITPSTNESHLEIRTEANPVNNNRWHFIPVSDFNQPTRNARIRYDLSYSGTQANLRTAFNNATSAFSSFGISFPPVMTDIVLDNTLWSSGCQFPSNMACDSLFCPVVGSSDSCNTWHHKSASKLLGMYSANNIYTVRVVNHVICWWGREQGQTHNQHHTWLGAAVVGRRDSISSTESPNFISTMQHELSHNLGANEHCNTITPTEWCVMKTFGHARRVMNEWCVKCREEIWHNR